MNAVCLFNNNIIPTKTLIPSFSRYTGEKIVFAMTKSYLVKCHFKILAGRTITPTA